MRISPNFLFYFLHIMLQQIKSTQDFLVLIPFPFLVFLFISILREHVYTLI